jgi:hypothetical protein
MLSTAFFLLILAPLFVGVGFLLPGRDFLLPLMGSSGSSEASERRFETYLLAFWLGWAAVLAFLQLWHFVFPVNGAAFLIVIVAGLAGWAVRRKAAWSDVLGLWQGRPGFLASAGVVGLVLAPALVVANHVMFVPQHFDHGLYHMQMVKWFQTYPVVPGLGNLHHRLAFNNANILYAAMINLGPLAGRSFTLSNTLLAWVLILQCGAGVYGLLRPKGTIQKSDLYFGLMFPAVIWQISTTHLPGYSPDIPVFALQVLLGGCLVRLFEAGSERESLRWGAVIAVLTAAGVAVKLSFAVFGLLVLLAAFLALLGRFGRTRTSRAWRLVLPAVGIMAIWVVPWLARNVIMTGFLLYPSPLISFPVPWKMPSYLIEPVTYTIATWARTLSNHIEYTGDWKWFLAWAKFFTFEAERAFEFGAIIAVLGAAAFVGLRRAAAAERKPRLDWAAVALFGISLASLAAWFFSAPDYRFSGACFWILLASALMFLFSTLTTAQAVRAAQALALGLLLFQMLWLSPNHFSNNLSRKLLINPVLEPQLAEEARPLSSAQVITTQSGLKVYAPVNPAIDCWNLPLPCAPSNDVVEKLSLMDPKDMGKGFFVGK